MNIDQFFPCLNDLRVGLRRDLRVVEPARPRSLNDVVETCSIRETEETGRNCFRDGAEGAGAGKAPSANAALLCRRALVEDHSPSSLVPHRMDERRDCRSRRPSGLKCTGNAAGRNLPPVLLRDGRPGVMMDGPSAHG